MTTRAPVCLRMEHIASDASSVTEISFGNGPVESLNSEAAIVDAVRERMERVPEGTISQEAIKICLCKPEVPTMEIIDLPGIVEGDLAEVNRVILREYLALPETLVLCVVDATFTNLGSCQAIHLVRDHLKEASTIITLTKADIVHPREVEKQIMQRVLRVRPGEEISQFAGCVAVINREHQDQVTLLEANDVEHRMFQQMFLSGRANELFAERQAEVEQNITTTKLIEQIVRLYCDFVQRRWKPNALQIMQGLMQPALVDLDGLGTPPGQDLVLQQVADHATSLMDWNQAAGYLDALYQGAHSPFWF